MSTCVTRRRLMAAGAAPLATVGCVGPGATQSAPHAGALAGTLTLYGWDQEPISSTRRRAMDGFRTQYPALTVEQVTTSAAGNTYFDKLQALIAGGSAPDMFIIQDSWLPFFLTRTLALNLDPLVKRDKYDLSDFPKGAIEAYRYQGGLYGLPDNITSHGFFVNHELFKQAGVEPPPVQADARGWTFDALLQRLQQLTARVSYAGTKNPEAAWAALKWFEDEGMKVLTSEGALQGTKMNAHQRALFVDPKQPPKHAELWVTSVERYGKTPPATTNWNDVEKGLNDELNPLWNGQRTARDAAAAIKQLVDPLVKAGKWG